MVTTVDSTNFYHQRFVRTRIGRSPDLESMAWVETNLIHSSSEPTLNLPGNPREKRSETEIPLDRKELLTYLHKS